MRTTRFDRSRFELGINYRSTGLAQPGFSRLGACFKEARPATFALQKQRSAATDRGPAYTDLTVAGAIKNRLGIEDVPKNGHSTYRPERRG